MLACVVILGISANKFSTKFWLTPASEWATAFVFVNCFALLSYTHNYYDSVTLPGKLVEIERQ